MFLFLQVDVLMGLNAIKENYRGFKDMYFLQYHTLAAIHFMNHEGICQIIRTICNIYIYLFKPLLMMWTKQVKSYDEKPRSQRYFYTWSTYFIHRCYLIFSSFFVCWHLFFTIFEWLILQCHYVSNLNNLLYKERNYSRS